MEILAGLRSQRGLHDFQLVSCFPREWGMKKINWQGAEKSVEYLVVVVLIFLFFKAVRLGLVVSGLFVTRFWGLCSCTIIRLMEWWYLCF